MTFDPEELRLAMRRWTTGVTIVTAADGHTRQGMTVSSFTSISLEPPLVLVSLNQSTRTHDLVLRTGCFGVTILSREQKDVSDRFAGRLPERGEGRFVDIETETLLSGVPFIKGGLAYLDCQVTTAHSAGTNTLFIAEVIAVRTFPDGTPLVYYGRDYRQMTDGRE